MRKLLLILSFLPLFCFSQTIRLKQISDFPSQTGHSGQTLTTDGSVLSWDASGGAATLDTSSMINVNLWSGLGLTDNRKFQYATDYARIRGKIVFAGWNNDRNSRTFYFDSAVLYQSHCNYYLVGCTIKKSNTCRDNLFRSANCGTGITNPLSTAYTDVSFTGYGWSIEGADNPRSSGDAYATISTSPTILNGYTYGTDAGVTGQSQHGDWRNNGIQGSNVSHIVISGGTIRNMEAYGITFGHSGYVLIENMTAEMYGYANNDTSRRMANQGTIDFHQGCHDITVRNCFGFSQDDFLAFNLTNNTDSTAGHWGYYPEGDSATAAFDSNYNIHCYNIHVGSNANTIRTFIPPGSFKGYNMWFVDISNELKPTDPFFHRLNGVEASAIVYGATQTGFYGGNISWGQWSNLNADRVRSYYTKYLIRVQNRIQDCNFTNLKPSSTNIAAVYKDGSYAEFKNVFSTRIDSSRITLASLSGGDRLQIDSTGRFYTADNNNVTIPMIRIGFGVTSFGTYAGNATGNSSTAVGDYSQYRTTGSNNTSLGFETIYSSGTGSGNVAIGYKACDSCGGASSAVAVGPTAAKVNTANNTVAIGNAALTANTSGTNNVAVGPSALTSNATGHDNTAVGNSSASTNTGNYNSHLGSSSGHGGNDNASVGYLSLSAVTGGENSGFGESALQDNSSGADNSALGAYAGKTTATGSYNIFIGHHRVAPATNTSRYLDIGGLIFSTTAYGTASNSSTAVSDPVVGIGITAPTSTLHVNGSLGVAYVAQTGTYTATRTDNTIECTSGTFTVTLPTAVGIKGRQYFITNSGSGTITLATTSSQTFVNQSGTPTTLTINQFGGFMVESNDANWIVVSKF